ncbi:hypothetical protein ACFY1U_49170 [Streptomyces sp. NPDC001351]|uniref:hypothetical protein n=1 Tax=Streptomyces sp. NPDC001351 TaxID=3364564 RepID=UPI003696ACA6
MNAFSRNPSHPVARSLGTDAENPPDMREDGAVGGGERGVADLTLQDQQLAAQRQDPAVLVAVAHRQKAQACEGVGGGEIGQAQQHERIMMVYAPVHVKRLGGLGHGQRSAVKAATWADDFSAPAVLRQVRLLVRPDTVLRWHRDLLARHQRHLLHTPREFEDFYNSHRPHQGITNTRPLQPLPKPITDPDAIAHLDIRRRDRLGGILHAYEHVA